MEPIAVATRRQLPSLHPLWKLLSPHLRGILAINTLGRETLIPVGGVADYVLSIGGGGLNVYIIEEFEEGKLLIGQIKKETDQKQSPHL